MQNSTTFATLRLMLITNLNKVESMGCPICTQFYYFGPSGVRALPLAAGINEGGPN